MQRKQRPVVFSRKGGLATLTLDRPEKRNALSRDMLGEIMDALEAEARRKEPARVVLVRAKGPAFCSGFYIKDLEEDLSSGAKEYLSGSNPFESAFTAIEDYPYPVIAGINGPAFGGGCMLAAACDVRLGAEGMTFSMSPSKLGLMYPAKGLARLVRTVGFSFAREMVLTAGVYDDQAALRTGFVSRLVPPDRLDAKLLEAARSMLEMGPLALRASKQAFRVLGEPVLGKARERELASLLALTARSGDALEGARSYLAKRKPVFRGR